MYPVIEFHQENVVMYMTKMNIEQLIVESKIMHYDSKSDSDYQRPPLPSHYRKIASYFMKEKSPILPSAIIAAMGREDYEIKNGCIIFNNKIRIVDGQHRIEGFKCLNNGYCKGSKERYTKLACSFEFPVIIMLIEKDDEMTEIDAFINLNSKGKRVKTDLAEALKNRISKRFFETEETISVSENYINMVAMNVARKININNEFWRGHIIQADEIGKRNEQPISIIAFTRAIKPIVNQYLTNRGKVVRAEENDHIEKELFDIVSCAWDIVLNRWKECFAPNKEYNNAYNICKGIGVVTLFGIFAECMATDEDYSNRFKEILDNSKVTAENWLVGGSFTGFASAQGFALVKRIIQNQESIESVDV